MATAARLTKRIARKVLSVVDKGLVSGLGNPTPGEMCVEAAVCYALGLPHSDDPRCVSPALRSLKITLNDSNWSSPQARAKGMRRLAIAQLGSADVLDEKEFVKQVALYSVKTIVPQALRAAAKCHPNKDHQEKLEAAAKLCSAVAPELDAASDAASYAASAASAASYAASAASYAASAASDAASAASYAASAASYAASAASDAASAASDAAGYAASAASDAAGYAAGYAARAARYAASAASYAASAASYAASNKLLAEFAEGIVQILIAMKAPGTKWLDITEE